ncbi:tyrosine-type recombinase/integrase [Neobacillus cucumis]|uniref:tyrosine-type recombinase/integrase n=1 Tax=Neobacillus cucumis TaxID=1740721 RepID=UPI001965C8FC|nr:tyrosine-type recombinase/integrase [Neobacillus cucumis]MBM7654570.1 integrase [Neobacillus cucumis]
MENNNSKTSKPILNGGVEHKHDKYLTPVTKRKNPANKKIMPRGDRSRFLMDIPPDVMWRLLELSKVYDPHISFPVCLQLTTGVRTGELCYIRQADCPNDDNGYTYKIEDGKLTSFIINFKQLVPMRNDVFNAGHMKTNSSTVVFPMFLPVIQHYHDWHMERLKSKTTEDGYYPLFIDQHGKALTVKEYCRRFDKLVAYLIQNLKDSNQVDIAQILLEHKLTPNSLRYWFTYQLVRYGLPPQLVSLYRGDKTIEATAKILY